MEVVRIFADARSVRRWLVLFVGGWLVLAAAEAPAATYVQGAWVGPLTLNFSHAGGYPPFSGSYGASASVGTQTISLPAFDASLGILTSRRFAVEGWLYLSQWMELEGIVDGSDEVWGATDATATGSISVAFGGTPVSGTVQQSSNIKCIHGVGFCRNEHRGDWVVETTVPMIVVPADHGSIDVTLSLDVSGYYEIFAQRFRTAGTAKVDISVTEWFDYEPYPPPPPAPVPVPAALPLFLAALAGLGMAGMRRRAS